MKKKFNLKKISVIGASVFMALALAFGMGFSDLSSGTKANIDNPNSSATVEGGGTDGFITNDKVVSNYATNANYGTLRNGGVYFYTDVNKIANFRSGSTGSDISSHKVNITDNNHGSADNPFVIYTVEQWNNFASDTTNATDSNKVFVLGADINFSGKTFKPIPNLSAKFYGGNYTLSNITYAFSTSLTTGAGIFNIVAQTAVITDLSVDNVTFTNVTTYGGFICGRSQASILNCHVRGKITGTTAGGAGIGGIVGNIEDNTVKVYIYRCTVFGDINCMTNSDGGVGGICGDVDKGAGVSVFDCVIICNYNFHDSKDVWFGGVLNGGAVKAAVTCAIENCIVYSNIKDTNSTSPYRAQGSLFNGWGGPMTFNTKNTYSAGNVTGTKAHDLYCGVYWTASNHIVTGSNVNWYATNPFLYPTTSSSGAHMVDAYANRSVSTIRWNNTSGKTRAAMWAAAVSNANLPDKIWVNKSVITDAYMTNTNVASQTGYTVKNSPVRNYLNTTVAFAEPNSENENMDLVGNENPIVYSATDVNITALPTPATTPAGKKFVGWSLNKTSDATVHTLFPAEVYGNVVMYPVWEMTGVSVTVKAEVAKSNGDISDANVAAKYIGEGVVTLKAAVTAPADLAKCTVTWSWYKNEGGSETKLEGETTDTLVLTELTSATYYAKVKIVNNEELWRTNPSSDVKSNEFNVTIAKGVLSPNGGITLKDKVTENGIEKDVYAYWGQQLGELTDKVAVNMQNTAGIAVAGTITWKNSIDKVENVQKTYEAYFHPTDTERYEDGTEISVTITPTILQRIYEFKISEQIDNQTFVFNEQYGTTYTKEEIANEFEETYFGWLNDLSSGSVYDAIVGRMPYFEGVAIDQYRRLSEDAAYFDAAHVADDGYIVKDKTNNTAILNIPVVFNTYQNSTKFTVTLFKTEMQGNLETTTQMLGYGATVAKPENTLHVADGVTQFLAGWYVSDTEGNILSNKTVWDFAGNRVTGTTFISADWMEGYLRLTSISARVNGSNRVFTARTAPKGTDYIVTGVYSVYANKDAADRNDTPQNTVELVLSSEDYAVSAAGGNQYYVREPITTQTDGSWTGKDTINVTALNDKNEEIKTTVEVTVKPMTLDLRGVNFPNQSKAYTGSMQTIGAAEYDFTSQGVSPSDYTVSYAYHNSSDTYLNTTGVTDIGTYYVYLTFTFNTKDIISGRVSATFTITEKPIEVYVQWNADNRKEYTYNGQIQHPEATFYRKDNDAPVTITFVYTGNAEQTNANADGAYSRIGVELRNSRYVLTTDATETIEFRINRAKVALPQLSNNSFEYKAAEYDISQYIGYNAETLEYLVRVENGKYTDVPGSGTITSNVYLRDAVNSEWIDGSQGSKPITWTITPKVMTVPTFTETLVYSGETYKIAEHLNFYDPVITVYGSETEATDAGIYRVNLRLPTANGGKNYVWDNAEFNGTVDWQIQKTELYLTWDDWSYLYNGNLYSPRARIAFGLVDADLPLAGNDRNFLYLGDTEKREAGSYKIEVQVSQTSEIFKNYVIAKDSSVFYWVIKENANEVVITVVWDLPADGGYTFNDQIQAPKVKALYSENGMGEANLDDYEITYTGDYNKSKWRGSYTVGVEIKAYDGTPIRVRQGECSYVIRRSNGQGDPPSTEPTDPDGPNPEKPTDTTVQYPIVQFILGGVGAILLVFSVAKTLGYTSATREAKKKTKDLAQISFSFAPVGLLAIMLGMEESAWWAISVSLLALGIISLAAMFVCRSKYKKALVALSEEQARVDDEKEAAKEAQQAARDAQMRAEQQRRDDEFRMMFAAMQQNYQQPQVGYEDMQNMISSAVAGLLPTMQQQMQALPPAQAESNDELRQLVAQQQEMLNQIMQNQQAQNDYFAHAQEYANQPQDEPVKTLFDKQPETEVVTLEESYGKLSDDAKRFYYEIGGYIMSKPETVQNDGKYAVLFKYRGRTLFKLCIRGEAPILYYCLENDGQGEVLITNAAALEDAKDVVDIRMKRVDREMNR